MIAPLKGTVASSPAPPPRIAAGARSVAAENLPAVEELNHKLGVGVGDPGIVYNEFARPIERKEQRGRGPEAPPDLAVDRTEESEGGGAFAADLDVGVPNDAVARGDGAFLFRLTRGVAVYQSNLKLFEGVGAPLGSKINVYL